MNWVGGKKKIKVYLPPKTGDKLQKIVADKIFPNGTIVLKKFGKHIYRGTITGFVDDEEIYYVDYEDGDYQKMTHQEVKKYKCDNTVDKPRTRFTISALNNKQQLANLVTRIEKAIKEDDKAYVTKPLPTIPPEFAFVVFDEESWKMMEMRKLIRHKNKIIQEQWLKAVSNEFGRLMKGIGKIKEV